MATVEVRDKEAGAFEVSKEERMPMSEMDAIIHILEDLHPHSVTEIASIVNIPAEKVELFFRFLAKYSFIKYDERRKTAVIHADFSALK